MKSIFHLAKDSLRIGVFLYMGASVATTAAINIAIAQPTANQLVDDQLFVAASVSSDFEIAGVNASVEDRGAKLIFAVSAIPNRLGPNPGWTNTVSLTGLVRGSLTLIVTAKDVFGNSISAQVSFMHDRRPVLIVSAPLPESVARPRIPVGFSCTDDGPTPCTLRILVNGRVVTTNQVGQLDLSAFDHSGVSLRFEATDSAGQVTFEDRGVFVETNPRLVPIGAAPPASDPNVKIVGDWQAFHDGGIWAAVTNTVTHYVASIQSDGTRTLALTATGTLFTDQVRYFSPDRGWFYAVMKLENGKVSPVKDQVAGRKIDTEFLSNYQPFWDGQNLLYRKRDPDRGRALMMLVNGTAGTETVIAGWSDFDPDYTATNGWVAFTQKGTSGQNQIWVRAPDDTKAQRTFFGSSSRIEALNPNGDVILSNGGVHYSSQLSATLLDLGPYIGQTSWQDGKWVVAIGRTLFSLDAPLSNVPTPTNPSASARRNVFEQSRSIPAPPGLIAWWPGDGNAQDIQGSNESSLKNGATFAPGIVNQAFRFDGVDDFVSISQPVNGLRNNLTVMAWVQFESFGKNVAAKVISKRVQGGFAPFEINIRNDGVVFSQGSTTGTSWDVATGETQLSARVWYHAAFVVDSGNLHSFYVNGQRRGTQQLARPLMTNSAPVLLGKSSDGFPLAGLVDEAAIFDRALTGSEIQAIYEAGNAGMCKFPEFIEIILLPDRSLQIRAKGQTGKDVTIQISGDLVQWQPLLTLPNPQGILEFIDPTRSILAQRFYRVAKP